MNYKIVKYSEIGKIRSGKRLPKGYTVSEKVSDNKYIRVRDINSGSIASSIVQYITDEAAEKLERYKVKTRDVIISVVGTVGAIAQIDESLNGAYLTENCDNLQVDESLCLKDYLKYYLLSEDGSKEIIANTVGSTQPKLPIYGIENFNIKLPSIDNQKRIVKLLNSIDKKIKLNNEINNNLYEMGDNLYNEYFGKYKDNLPSDYKIVKLNEVADNYDSKRKPMSSREREQHRGIYPYYGATSIIDYVDDYIFDDIYLLMGEDGTVKTNDGYPVLQYIWGKNWINNHAHVLKGKNISTELLMFALRKINIENIITGAVQPKINQENMNKIEFVIGSDSKNKELEDILKILMDKSKNIIEENKKLEELRDTLLPKLMNGEIDLDNIEI